MSKNDKFEMSLASAILLSSDSIENEYIAYVPFRRKEGETTDEFLKRVKDRGKNEINIDNIDYMELTPKQFAEMIKKALNVSNIKKKTYPECPYFLKNKEYGCEREPIRETEGSFLGYLSCDVIEKCDMKKFLRRNL